MLAKFTSPEHPLAQAAAHVTHKLNASAFMQGELLSPYARLYADYGIAVAPWDTINRGPLTKGGFNDATRDIAQITKWWSHTWPLAGIVAPCKKRNNFLVIDVDRHPGADGWTFYERCIAPYTGGTLEAVSGGGGRHVFFKATDPPAGRTWKSPAPGIDLIVNGAITLSPSPHKSGSCYEWDNPGADIEPLPAALITLFTVEKPKLNRYDIPAALNADAHPYALKILKNEAAALASMAPESGRNNKLNGAAVRLFRFALAGQINRATVEGELTAAAHACGLGDIETQKTLTSAWRGAERLGAAYAPELN